MLTLHHEDGRSWPVSDAFLQLAELPDPELHALLDLARAQARLDASTRPATGEIVQLFNCRHAREAMARSEPPPKCRWSADPAGGFACLQCGTWAKPDSERARVIRLAVVPAGPVHVSELRAGDMFRFAGEGRTDRAERVTVLPDKSVRVHHSDRLGNETSTRCTTCGVSGDRVMVEIISRGPVSP
jgi:hypothetical protein